MIAEQWGISASLFLRVGQSLGRAGLTMTWLIAVLLWASGCSSIASSAAAGVSDDLSWAILNQDDPQLVAEGLPA